MLKHFCFSSEFVVSKQRNFEVLTVGMKKKNNELHQSPPTVQRHVGLWTVRLKITCMCPCDELATCPGCTPPLTHCQLGLTPALPQL